MLFNSFTFILFFLPVVLAGSFVLARRYGATVCVFWALACSLFFYAWWNPRFMLLLIPSILFNYLMGIAIDRAAGRTRLIVLWASILANLTLLGYFKYANFLVDVANSTGLVSVELARVALPLGISFFTLQQIAFLVDTWKGDGNENHLPRYALFVCFYPHLIAGPIVHHKGILPQFRKAESFRYEPERVARGLTWFALGLFKKIIIADQCSLYVTPVFDAVAQGAHPGMASAWMGALAYTFQLYFDFSAYSDMAIGLALLLGINLPVNFLSPYKSGSIIEFWRRWHMTLSGYLRDYVYIPLGGNRKGPARRLVNLLLTMLIGGIWHGAGWTFALWGALHGVYLLINHAWRMLLEKLGVADWNRHGLYRALAWMTTFAAVVLGWVVFRAPSVHDALVIGRSLVGLGPGSGQLSGAQGNEFTFGVLGVVAAVAFFAPNSQELMNGESRLSWRPQWAWAWVTAAMFMVSLFSLHKPSEFLYFRF